MNVCNFSGFIWSPAKKFENEKNYHSSLELLCNKFNSQYYEKFKKWCDEYFYLKHRKETRGAGGIFFDYLDTNNWEKDFDFIISVDGDDILCAPEGMRKIYDAILAGNQYVKTIDECPMSPNGPGRRG